ncbi:Ig-like domain-containing protein [Maribacter chungangensis]|uniref:Ig-like domain-containing protein n=1 Tax=Maribacter chungangensis TaxID=1069117 RepID=A0ABW3AYB0_9FLAO
MKFLFKKPLNYFFGIFALLLFSAMSYFSGSGLSSAEPLGNYLNNNFPATVSTSQGVPYEPVFPNLTFDSPLTFNEDPAESGRIIIGQRDGKIYWIDKGAAVPQKNLLLDLSDRVGVVWDGGFLGLAIHPNFGNGSNSIYVYYTTKDRNGNNFPNRYTRQSCDSEEYWGNFLVLSKYTVNPRTFAASASSEKILLKLRMYGTTHRGGGLLFGDDGFLYLTTGDQTAFKKSQDIANNLDGGVLRFDVDMLSWRGNSHPPVRTMPEDHGFSDEISGRNYWIPNDNPFQSPNGELFEEYYSMGHRNPHRMTKDRETGDLYIGEIGGGRHEEVNVVKRGGNFGWPLYEGLYRSTFCVPSLYNNMPHEEPLVAFPRSQANAIIGGYVYRGEEIPELRGKYICADYGNGEEIWAVDTSDGSYEQLGSFSSTNIISFGEDRQGELYILKQGVSTLFKMVTKKTFEETLPQKLSETGAFANLQNLTPTDGLIPYDLVESFWSDGALKKRWIGIPNNGTHNTSAERIEYSENGNWNLPIGSVLIKHFEMPLDENNPSVTKRLETRFSVKAKDGSFYFATYKWNNAQTDATLLTSGLDETLNIAKADGTTDSQIWRYPSTAECVTCHNQSTGGTIGVRTRYLNKDFTYPKTGRTANQLVTLSHLGILDRLITDNDTDDLLTYKAIDDETATIDERARSYMDINCAYCHQQGSDVRANFDLRMSLDLSETGLLTAGFNNSLGVPGEAILVEGDPDKSILYLRTNSLQPGVAMPPLAKGRIHTAGVALIEEWIRKLDDEPVATIAPYNVIATPAEVTLSVGETVQLSATIEPTTATNKKVTWFSNNTAIAAIDKNTGLVTAVGNGEIDVTVTTEDGGFKSSSLITVVGGNEPIIPVYNVLAAPSEVTLNVGETVQLTANTEPSNATDKAVTWISNNPGIARIDADTGLVTAVGNGEIDVTVTTNDGGYKASALVKVVGGSEPVVGVYNVTISPAKLRLNLGESFSLRANVEPSNATNKDVTWFSNNPSIASVNANTGRVTATGIGEIDLTVRTDDGGYNASILIEVVAPTGKQISMYPVPAKGVLNVDLSAYKNKEVEIKLYDQNNRMLEVFKVDKDHEDMNQLILDNYPKGFYYLLFQTNNSWVAEPLIID